MTFSQEIMVLKKKLSHCIKDIPPNIIRCSEFKLSAPLEWPHFIPLRAASIISATCVQDLVLMREGINFKHIENTPGIRYRAFSVTF